MRWKSKDCGEKYVIPLVDDFGKVSLTEKEESCLLDGCLDATIDLSIY